MPKYENIARNAFLTLQKSGVQIILSRVISTFDPVVGIETPTGVFTMTLTGILKSPKTFRGNTGYDEVLENAAMLGRAKVLYCAAHGLLEAPQLGDIVTISDISFKVHAITILEPGGLPITYSLTLIQS